MADDRARFRLSRRRFLGTAGTAGLVSRQRLLPAKVGEWGVDVVDVRRPSRHAATSATSPTAEHTSLKEVWRPVIQGVSIGNLEDRRLAGTLGAIVFDKSDSTVCVLSSNHVIGRNDNAATGEAITQPAPADDPDHADANKVATFKRAVPISNVPGTTTNRVDAAIARLNDPSGYSADVAFGLMKPISPTHPAVGMVVAGDPGTNCFLTRELDHHRDLEQRRRPAEHHHRHVRRRTAELPAGPHPRRDLGRHTPRACVRRPTSAEPRRATRRRPASVPRTGSARSSRPAVTRTFHDSDRRNTAHRTDAGTGRRSR
jgi:hypothetical protein